MVGNTALTITLICHCCQGVENISYLGKGTYIDCALTNMTQKMLLSRSHPMALQFAVIITDGHVTGNPCGGIKVAAERAREESIRIFSVATTRDVDETGLREIASSPATVYRRDFIAVDLSRGRADIHTETIDHIIETMVRHRHTHRDTQRNMKHDQCFLCLHFVSCLHRNIWHM